MYSVMWSEHCSYKSSKVWLRQFGQKVSPEMTKNLMVGMGENAGVIDIGEGWAVTFKIESHNHPSYIEPFQGAATGVGGIVRDIISMGARPVAVMDALRFGAIDHPDTARVVPGVVSGISFYGNCLGLPNIGGETWFDPVYQANPLVNALAVGVLRHEDLHLANARGRRQQGRAVRRADRGRRDRRGVDPGIRHLLRRRPDQAPERAGRRPVRREGAHRVLPRAVRGRAGRGHPGSRRGRHLLRDQRAGEQRRRGHGDRAGPRAAARSEPERRRDPDVREPGAHDGGRRAVQARGLPGRDLKVGCRDQRARRGHRHRPARHHLARRDDRGRRPPHRRDRRPGLRPTRGLSDLARRGSRPTRHPRLARPADGDGAAARSWCSCSAARTSPTRAGSPASTTSTCSATPP